MPKAVGRVKIFQPFSRQDFFQIFTTEPVYSVPGKFLSLMIEKQAIAVKRMWCNAVLFYIQANEIRRFGPEVYHSETPSFTENGQRFFLWIKKVELESSHFAGSGAGVEKQIEYGIISEALC